jgi:hypothetical protein
MKSREPQAAGTIKRWADAHFFFAEQIAGFERGVT